MSIVSSVTVSDIPTSQGGNRYVIEQHTDSTGTVHTVRSFVAAGVDAATVLAAHAVDLADRLAEAEAQQLLEG